MAYDAHQNYRPPPRQYYDQGGYDDAHYNNGYGQAQQYDGYGYDDGYQNGYYDDGYGGGYSGGYGGDYQQQQGPPPRQNGPPAGYGRPPQSYGQGPPPGGAPRGRGGGPGPAPRGRGGYGPPGRGGYGGPPPRGPPQGGRPPQDYGPNGEPMGRGRPPPQNAPPRAARAPNNRPASPQTLPFDNPFPVFSNIKSPPRSKGRPVRNDAANETMKNGPGPGAPNGDPYRNAPRKMSKASDGPRPSLDGSRPHMPGYARGHDQFDHPPPPQRSHTAKPDNSIGGFRMPFGSPEQPRPLARSQTMPQNYQDEYGQQWQEPGPVAGYYGPDSESYIARPTTSGGERRPPPPQQAQPPAPYAPLKYQPDKRDTVEEVVDHYYNNQHGHDPRKPLSREDAIEAEMPDFDSAPQAPTHRRGLSFEEHLTGVPGTNAPAAHQQDYPPEPRGRSNSNFSQPLHRSRSQPDFNRGQEPNYAPDDAPPMPQMSRTQTFNDQGGYGGYGQAPPPPRPGTSSGYGRGPPGQAYGAPAPNMPRGTPGPPGPPGPGMRPYGGRPDHLQRNATDMSQSSDPGPNGRYNNGPPNQPLPDHRARGPPLQTNMGQRGPNNMMSPVDQRNNVMSPADQRNNMMSPQRGNNMMSPVEQRGNNVMSPADNRNANPDALPHHPSPVRPGLQQPGGQQAPQQSGKPIPIRQHNGNPNPDVPGGPSTSGSQRKARRGSDPITMDQLARLRNDAASRPNDKDLQLRFAKKLVEAAAVLADEGGRADPKTRNKNRERYTMEAHKIVKKLAHNKHPEAMFYMADSLGSGQLGLEPNEKEAFSMYLEAAKLGHAQAAYRTAVCCEIGAEDGGGTRKDPVKAVQWYKRAAALGDTAAMYKMGMILLKGLLNQQKSPAEAITWLKRAADHANEENPHALHELALLYSNKAGSRDAAADVVARDEQYAFNLFKKAADFGYKFSQFRLGEAFEYGSLGCPVDTKKSIAWYTRAAAQEEHQSELALSGWYLTGSPGILEQSDTEAYLWARKAACADPPLPKAMFAMGYYTEVGIGCPRSLEEAKRWYGRAASYNFPKARERLEELKRGGAKVQKGRERLSRSNKEQHEENCVVM
ncbi:Sel1-like protein [Lasiodiplodia theobromae]|uniref:Sel1-like protein n=1 Tax=Lasiodiplodia theobromae TaxID=45133 RepID=UPI0015C2CF67|nr:Sel1-like protein [Lasiodiplodia theobromae]KAF4537629.1 Sel1-like protein [Lasiodiplodia theobromae]KAF9639402.1 Sel1-like protein [Lasiodiplodia theobromae]